VFRAGAGSAGAVVANRLTENPNWKASADDILHPTCALFIRKMLMFTLKSSIYLSYLKVLLLEAGEDETEISGKLWNSK
jgi:hypothetical protein